MDDCLAFIFLDCLDQRWQIPHVALHNGNVGAAELVREKIFARCHIVKYDAFTSFDRVLRIGSADQSQTCDKCCRHVRSFLGLLSSPTFTYCKVPALSRAFGLPDEVKVFASGRCGSVWPAVARAVA